MVHTCVSSTSTSTSSSLSFGSQIFSAFNPTSASDPQKLSLPAEPFRSRHDPNKRRSHANEMLHHKANLNGYLSYHTGQESLERINQDTDYNFFMSAKEAKE
ncbi:hypothetical protein I3842_08G089700 [Carya illinoinensis]|uniref:Uncharacterized protein n=1 Tax=Carya illinoinensis TaxID=32201 RepID=A0A922J9N0_CARIL|nr:hypothetical protein I3842_08G089700 [Carya illinoinensis]